MFRIVLIVSILFYLTGCSFFLDRIEKVPEKELHLHTPKDYEIYDVYYHDLDGDKIAEAIVIYQQSRQYYSEDEKKLGVPKILPIKLRVLDKQYGKWIATQVNTVANEGQHVYNPGLIREKIPYYILSKDSQEWLILFTFKGGYSGVEYSADVYSYDEKHGLYAYQTTVPHAISGVISTREKSYFINCTTLFDNDEGLYMFILDLSGKIPKVTRKNITEVDCPTFERELEKYPYEDRKAKVGTVLDKFDVKLD